MLLPTVLQTQEQIRDGKISRDDAINQLKLTLMYWAKAGESKQEDLQSASIFGSGGASSSSPHSNSPTMPTNTMPPGMALAQSMHTTMPPVGATSGGGSDDHTRPSGFVHPAQQSQAASMPPQQQAPQMVPQQGSSQAPMAIPNPIAAAPGTPNMVSLVELLKLSGVCTQQSLEQAIANALEDPRVASKVLLACGIVDSETLNMYVRCQALIARGVLRTDQVLYALNSVRHRKVSFEQAVAELGVTVPV
jgi:hypothetical protein